MISSAVDEYFCPVQPADWQCTATGGGGAEPLCFLSDVSSLFRLRGTKIPADVHLSASLLLRVRLRSRILLNPLLLFLLLPLVQRAKRRAFWRRRSSTGSRQQLISADLRLTARQLSVLLWTPMVEDLELLLRAELHQSASPLPRCPSRPLPITTASLWTCAAWGSSPCLTPSPPRSGEDIPEPFPAERSSSSQFLTSTSSSAGTRTSSSAARLPS